MTKTILKVAWEHRFNIAGAVFALITAYAALTDSGNSWPVALLSLAFFILGNVDRFESLKAGPGGFEATMRKALQETNSQIGELKELAYLFGSTTIANIAMMGRWNGFSDEQEEKMISDITSYFDKIGLTEDQKQASLALWYRVTEHDYRSLCTGGSYLPKDLPQEHKEGWDAVREGGINRIASPREIEAFFESAGMLTDERRELLQDYRYYLEHRAHRRPDVWARRHEYWPHP